MIYSSDNINHLNLSKLDPSNFKFVNNMFYSCYGLKELNIKLN